MSVPAGDWAKTPRAPGRAVAAVARDHVVPPVAGLTSPTPMPCVSWLLPTAYSAAGPARPVVSAGSTLTLGTRPWPDMTHDVRAPVAGDVGCLEVVPAIVLGRVGRGAREPVARVGEDRDGLVTYPTPATWGRPDLSKSPIAILWLSTLGTRTGAFGPV